MIPIEPVDSLLVRAGSIRQDAPPYRQPGAPATGARLTVWSDLPGHLPDAREYWLVFRYEAQGVPDPSVLDSLRTKMADVALQARNRELHVAGIQLDIDSPTRSLPEYATFLAGVRTRLPKGYRLSITALLDWFRGSSAIESVIAQVDEFVPQFYDTNPLSETEPAIAAKIDEAKWGPAFRRFRKPFRIGVSTFGRSKSIDGVPKAGSGPGLRTYPRIYYTSDLTPLDLATTHGFQVRPRKNDAGELVLTYRAERRTTMGDTTFEPGQGVEFILATPDSIRSAAASARRMGSTGVVYFRWPSSGEKLVMQPNEVLAAAAGEASTKPITALRVLPVDGGCAVTHCADLYLEGADAFSPNPLRFTLKSSTPLEYFLPAPRMPVRMAGASEIELTLPPFGGRGRLLLGRAVTADRTKFSVMEAAK